MKKIDDTLEYKPQLDENEVSVNLNFSKLILPMFYKNIILLK